MRDVAIIVLFGAIALNFMFDDHCRWKMRMDLQERYESRIQHLQKQLNEIRVERIIDAAEPRAGAYGSEV